MPDLQPEASLADRELNTDSHGVGLTEPHTEPAASPARLRLYVGALLLAPLIFLAACLLVIRTDFFDRHDQNIYLATMAYGAKLRVADCRILVYGDSSAMVGVDPATVEQSTGLSTCNIAEAAGMTMVNGTMILDEYLKHNAPPRYVVFLFAPENLAPATTWKYIGYFEAVLIRLQRLDPAAIRLFLSHPEEVLATVEMAGRFALSWAPHKPLPEVLVQDRARNRGRLDAQGEPLRECGKQAPFTPPSRAWTDRLRSRYGTSATRVLVDATPVPACDAGLATYRADLSPARGIIDNAVETYPVNWFTNNGRLHMSPEGIASLSRQIAAQIKAEEAR